MAVPYKDWKLLYSRIWLADIDIEKLSRFSNLDLHPDRLYFAVKNLQIKGGETELQVCCCLLLSVAKEISKSPFLAPEIQWASKFTVFVRFTFPSNVSNHAHIWHVTWP